LPWRFRRSRDRGVTQLAPRSCISPIGPLRLDAGWKLDPDEGESRGPVLLISFGNPF
jgi:hypothetical protein